MNVFVINIVYKRKDNMGKKVLAENKSGIQLVEFINCNNEDMLINYNITSAFAFIKCDNKLI